MSVLEVLASGPAVTVQDLGRIGYIAQGLTRGGAMDRLALYEGAALLERPVAAAIEMIGFGGTFRASKECRIALTGAEMRVTCDGAALAWNASHLLPAGAVLEIGSVLKGAIGYLHVGAGFDVPHLMGAQSAHLAAGLGSILKAGNQLDLAPDRGTRVGFRIAVSDRFQGGEIAIVRSMQTDLFGEDALARFVGSEFTRDIRANRQGIRLNPNGDGFASEGALSVVSEIIVPGDIQVTGDGAPYVLMCESQTTGGYPRLASVLPSDLPRVAQAPAGAKMTVRLLDRSAAVAQERAYRSQIAALPKACMPMVRDPTEMADLLSYSLIDGAVSAFDAGE